MTDNASEPVVEIDLVTECRGELEIVKQELDHLKTALVSARRIGAAIGILMARRNITDDQAFELLRSASNRRNVKLRQVSEDVLWTGELAEPSTTNESAPDTRDSR